MNKPPEKLTKGDIIHTVVKAAASAIPVAGGSAAVLFEEIFRKPLEKRRNKWLEILADAIEELKSRVEDLENKDLSENEPFISAVMQASQIALRTNQDEKLRALRNAIQNATLPKAPNEDLQHIFLRFIDELTSWHFRLLDLFDSPEKWGNQNKIQFPDWSMGGGSTVLEFAFPDLRGNRDFYDQLIADLQVRGLLSQGGFLHTTMTGGGMMASRTTSMGKQFLRYIREPWPLPS